MRARLPSFVLVSLFATLGCQPATDAAKTASKTEGEAASPTAAKTPVKADAVADTPAAGQPSAEAEEGCIHGKSDHAGCEAGAVAAATGTGHFGAPFAKSEAVSLSAAVAGSKAAEAGANAAQLVRGEVKAVCQAKGCWMVLQDDADASLEARVIMKNHAFAVPFDGKGKKARVEGVLTSRTFTPAQVKHLAKDAGRDPATVEAAPRTEWVLTATGVELAG